MAPSLGAQDEEEPGGLLVGFLEDSLSGDNRSIKVTGLEGALSSKATIRKLTIADDEGIWLSIDGAVLDWNRLALIRGEFSVNALSAEAIEIARAPNPTEAPAEIPEPGATPFQVPELPVAINLGEIRVDRLVLGEELAGISAELTVNGALQLAGGALNTDLAVTRLDRPGDGLKLDADFANDTRVITLDLTLDETADGLIAGTLGIPGAPPVQFAARGSGPVEDFTADITLATEGVERLGGQVALKAVPGEDAEAGDSIGFRADLGGDVTALMEETFRPFFGPDTRLQVDGQSDPDGRLIVRDLSLNAAELALNGSLELAPGGILEDAVLDARIAPADQDQTVVLPIGEPRTELESVVLSLRKDPNDPKLWDITADLRGLDRPDLRLKQARVSANGILDQSQGLSLDGLISAGVVGIDFADPALAQAVGGSVNLRTRLLMQGDGAMQFRDLNLNGADYGATGQASIRGLESGMAIDGDLAVEASDLSRFSGLAGQDLAGAVRASVAGNGAPLSGSFDVDLDLQAEGLSAGMAEIDPLIEGETTLRLSAARDTTGLRVEAFDFAGVAMTAKGKANVSGAGDEVVIDGDLQFRTPDLSRFSVLSGMDLTGAVAAKIAGNGAPYKQFFDVDLDLQAEGLSTGLPEYDPLIEGRTELKVKAANGEDGLVVEGLDMTGTALTASGRASASSLDEDMVIDADLQLKAPDLSRLSALTGFDLTGDVSAIITGNGAPSTRFFDLDLDLEAEGLGTGMAAYDPLIEGSTRLKVKAANGQDGLSVEGLDLASAAVTASGRASASSLDENMEVEADLKVQARDLSRFAALVGQEIAGAVRLTLVGSGVPKEADFDVDLDLRADNLQSGIEQVDPLIAGSTTLVMRAAKTGKDIRIDEFDLNGTQIEAQASGVLDSRAGTLNFRAVLADMGLLVPQLPGRMALSGDVSRKGDGLDGKVRLEGPHSSYAELDGLVALDGTMNVDFDARFEQLERFLPEFPGTIAASGTAQRRNALWQVDGSAKGPAGIDTTVVGSWDETQGIADIRTQGQVRLDAANQFITPNSVSGLAKFDLALKGPPALESLSGQITTGGSTVAVPAAWQFIENLSATIDVADSRANVRVSGTSRAGGGFEVSGPLALTAPFDGNITTRINGLVLTDNLSFTTTTNGQLVFSGPLTGNGNLVGQINFSETEINVANASGGVSVAPIPDNIRHVGEPSSVRSTRDRAGLIQTEKSGTGPVIGLDIFLNAPNRIFARGRGLQAELGGQIHVRGTTAAIAPSGQIQLIRGTFNILGRRLNLTEGVVSLQGDLKPYLQFSSTTNTSDGTATIEISGPIDAPEITVYSDPPRPSEEALALLLFGDNFDNLSPLALAQMAASVAQLSGATDGASGTVREGLGTDTAEIGGAEGGGAQLGAGSYIAENIYTDFSINTRGESELQLNLDVTESLTLRGTVDNAGDTGIGIFFKRDY